MVYGLQMVRWCIASQVKSIQVKLVYATYLTFQIVDLNFQIDSPLCTIYHTLRPCPV